MFRFKTISLSNWEENSRPSQIQWNNCDNFDKFHALKTKYCQNTRWSYTSNIITKL